MSLALSMRSASLMVWARGEPPARWFLSSALRVILLPSPGLLMSVSPYIQLGHVGTESFFDVMISGRCVLHSVVQPCGGDHLFIATNLLDQIGNRPEVYFIGLLCVFPPVVDALMCTRGESLGTFDEIGHEAVFSPRLYSILEFRVSEGFFSALMSELLSIFLPFAVCISRTSI